MDDHIIQRFWSRVVVGSPDECWPWTAWRNSKGYGLFWNGERSLPAQRCAYEIANKVSIRRDLFVCHTCDNPPCCNPRHLFVGTNSDNMCDSVSKGRRSHLIGEKHNRAILTERDVVEIRERYAVGEYTIDLAEEYEVSQPTISAICSGRNWKNAGGPVTKRRRGPRSGVVVTHAKLTIEDVRQIRKSFTRGSAPVLAKRFGVKLSCIYAIVEGRTWRWVK